MDKLKRIHAVGFDPLDIGKIPPQSIDLEEAVLGAIMYDKNVFKNICSILNSDDFYNNNHVLIYDAISTLYENKQPIDILTVVNQLKAKSKLEQVGGAYYISQLTNKVTHTVNTPFHARIIAEKSMLRKQILNCQKYIAACYEETASPFVLLSTQRIELANIEKHDDEDFSGKTRMKNTLDAIERAKNNDGMAGTPTGIKKLDKFTGGITAGDYYVFSARSGSFKTALMLWIQHQVDIFGHPTLMFQQEMTDVQLGLREIALKSGLSTQDLRRGRISDSDYENFSKSVGKIENSNVFVDVSVGQTLQSIRAKTQRAIDEHGIKFIVIDYLQLCNIEEKKHGGTEPAIAHHCKSMKAMAKELNIAILELVQFTKEASNEPLKPPTMNLLKGSSAIEQSADFIGLFWNPAKYDPNFVYTADNEPPVETKDKIAIIVAKNKNGDTGLFWHGVKAASNQFFELDDNDYEPNKHIEPNFDFENDEKPNILTK